MIKKIIFSAATIFFILGAKAQTNYYVSPSGSNSNTGTLASPWLTVQYGLNQTVSGDTLNLKAGTYFEKIQIPFSWLYVRNNPGDVAVIDATGIINQNSIVEIYDVSNITIDGLELQNNIMNDAQGILIEHNCQNITLKNCKIHDIHFSSNVNTPVNANTNAQGIIVYGSDANNSITNLKIENNELYSCRLGFSEGIAVNGNVDGFEVIGNTVHDITNIGIDLIGFEATSSNPANDQARNGKIKNNLVYNCLSSYATSGGIYIDGGKNLIVENNTSYHNGYGIEVGCENIGEMTENITVRDNVLYDNEVAALAFGGFDYPNGSGKVVNSSFTNNTCYFNDYSNSGNGEMYISYSENCTIENNIFNNTSQNKALAHSGTVPVNLSLNYNLYFGPSVSLIEYDYNGSTYTTLANFTSATAKDANSITGNPNFVLESITSPDFHLQSNSPAINAGNPNYTVGTGETDLDGQNRLVGVVDCGADEYGSVVSINTIEQDKIKFFPNPTHGIIKTTDFSTFTFKVYSLSGQLVKSQIKYLNIIDISELNNGIYFIQLTDNNKNNYNLRVVKK